MRVVFQQYLMSDKNLKQLKHSKHEKNYRSNIGNSVNQIICRVKLRSEKKWKIKCKANKESKFTLLLLFLINQNNLLVTRNFPMEKAMAPHSSTLAWKIPWAEEPGGLPSTGSHRVGRDGSDLAAAAAAATGSPQKDLETSRGWEMMDPANNLTSGYTSKDMNTWISPRERSALPGPSQHHSQEPRWGTRRSVHLGKTRSRRSTIQMEIHG